MDTITGKVTDEDARIKKRAFYEAMAARLAVQMQGVAGIDQKVGIWFQAAPLITTLLVALLVAAKDGANQAVIIVAGQGLIVFVIGLIVLYLAHRPVDYPQGMNWEDFADNVNDDSLGSGEFFYKLGYYLAYDTLESNKERIRKKARTLNQAVILFCGSAVLLLIAILISIANTI